MVTDLPLFCGKTTFLCQHSTSLSAYPQCTFSLRFKKWSVGDTWNVKKKNKSSTLLEVDIFLISLLFSWLQRQYVLPTCVQANTGGRQSCIFEGENRMFLQPLLLIANQKPIVGHTLSWLRTNAVNEKRYKVVIRNMVNNLEFGCVWNTCVCIHIHTQSMRG